MYDEKPVDMTPVPMHSDIPAPNSRFLLLHASVARVVHASGCAESIERFWRELEDGEGLAADGSTDTVALALSMYLGSTDIPPKIRSAPESFAVDMERTSTTDSSTSMSLGLVCYAS